MWIILAQVASRTTNYYLKVLHYYVHVVSQKVLCGTVDFINFEYSFRRRRKSAFSSTDRWCPRHWCCARGGALGECGMSFFVTRGARVTPGGVSGAKPGGLHSVRGVGSAAARVTASPKNGGSVLLSSRTSFSIAKRRGSARRTGGSFADASTRGAVGINTDTHTVVRRGSPLTSATASRVSAVTTADDPDDDEKFQCEGDGEGDGSGAKIESVVPPRSIDANDINYRMMALSVAVGLGVRFLFPVPESLTPQAWNLFAIFCSTVTGLVVKPAPVGAWAFMSLTFTVVTKTLTFQQGLAALTNEVIWLIVVATFFARAFIKTGFGDRLGLLFVKAFGTTTLRLAYGLQTAEAVLSPAMPSTTARAAGVFIPVINALDIRTRKYLIAQQLQGGNVTSCLLVSAAAQNFLCMQIATGMVRPWAFPNPGTYDVCRLSARIYETHAVRNPEKTDTFLLQKQGILFTNPFLDWFIASSVPCFLSILVTPLVIYMIDPPDLKETPEAPIAATKALQELGPMKGAEAKVRIVFPIEHVPPTVRLDYPDCFLIQATNITTD